MVRRSPVNRRNHPASSPLACLLIVGIFLVSGLTGLSNQMRGTDSRAPKIGIESVGAQQGGASPLVAVIQPPPRANWSDDGWFGSITLQGAAPLAVNLSSVVTGGVPPYRYAWDAGDGAPTNDSAAWNHTFLDTGIYVETLVVTDALGNESFSSIPVVVLPPRTAEYYALLSVDPSLGSGPLNASYGFNTDSWNPVAATFNFGDGTEANWTGQVGPSFMWTPHSHIYGRPGVYPLSAQIEEYNFVNHTFGNTTTRVTVLVGGNLSGPWVSPAGGFTQMNCSSPISMNATFDAGVVGGVPPYRYVWSFGDGSPLASGESVRHSFPLASTPGLLSVEVLVEDGAGEVATAWPRFLGPTQFASDCPATPPAVSQPGFDLWEVGFGAAAVGVLTLSVVVIRLLRRGREPGGP